MLLIATANVGTLLSLRSARRRREIAVRIAMGAGHADLARQLLVESVLLAAIGAVVGLLLSRWFSDVMRVTLLPNLASTRDVRRPTRAAGVRRRRGARRHRRRTRAARAGRDGTNLSAQLRSAADTARQDDSRFRIRSSAFRSRSARCCSSAPRCSSAACSACSRRISDSRRRSSLWMTLDFRGYVPGAERDLAYYDAVERVRGVAGVGSATVVAGHSVRAAQHSAGQHSGNGEAVRPAATCRSRSCTARRPTI